MSKPKSPARKPLEVTIMFEPTRLAAEHLADAYLHLVPLRRHHTRAPTKTTTTNRHTDRSAQTRRQRS